MGKRTPEQMASKVLDRIATRQDQGGNNKYWDRPLKWLVNQTDHTDCKSVPLDMNEQIDVSAK